MLLKWARKVFCSLKTSSTCCRVANLLLPKNSMPRACSHLCGDRPFSTVEKDWSPQGHSGNSFFSLRRIYIGTQVAGAEDCCTELHRMSAFFCTTPRLCALVSKHRNKWYITLWHFYKVNAPKKPLLNFLWQSIWRTQTSYSTPLSVFNDFDNGEGRYLVGRHLSKERGAPSVQNYSGPRVFLSPQVYLSWSNSSYHTSKAAALKRDQHHHLPVEPPNIYHEPSYWSKLIDRRRHCNLQTYHRHDCCGMQTAHPSCLPLLQNYKCQSVARA